ncbi:MAG: DUF2075 domain-containing protein, partial [Gammaproteobacteria bacterium]
MYKNFYRLKEKPFTLLPDPNFLYLGKKHSMAYSMLEYGLESEAGFTVITGEVGCGKTTLIRHLLNQMPQKLTVGLISNTHKSLENLLQWVAYSFDIDFRNKSDAELYQDLVDFMIKKYAQGKRVVIIVDEAQNMEPDVLEELRVLSNINADKYQVLQIVIVGQPELRDILQRQELRQFAQRVVVDYHIDKLNQDEVRKYIQHRIQVAGGSPEIFSDCAIEAISNYSGGVPRLVNSLADMSLVYGYAE